MIELNHYFPAESIHNQYFAPSDTHSVCPWKGTASYYTIKVDGKENRNTAWYYPETREMAKGIKGRIAFWKGVGVVK